MEAARGAEHPHTVAGLRNLGVIYAEWAAQAPDAETARLSALEDDHKTRALDQAL